MNYTIHKSLLTTTDSNIKANALLPFVQNNDLKACIDTDGLILAQYREEENNDFLREWVNLMRNADYFEYINISNDSDDPYLKVCASSKYAKKLLVRTIQDYDQVSRKDNLNYVLYNGSEIQVIERTAVVREINHVLTMNDSKKKNNRYAMKIFNFKPYYVYILLFSVLTLTIILKMYFLQSNTQPLNSKSETKFYKKNQADGIIIFIHGFGGDSQTTWKNENSNYNFPELVANDTIFSKYDVMSFGYQTLKYSVGSSISEISEGFRSEYLTYELNSYKKIIFVAHSMGGLVARNFILKYQNKFGLGKKVKLLYFYGTPTNGTSTAKLFEHITKNSAIKDMDNSDTEMVITDETNNWLANDSLKQIPSYAAYEKLPTYGLGVVVPSSATALINKAIDPIEENHINLVKPLNRKAKSYQVFRNAFKNEGLANFR